MSRILIVDDETNLRRILSVLLQADGHAVTEAVGRADAVALLASAPFDLVKFFSRTPRTKVECSFTRPAFERWWRPGKRLPLHLRRHGVPNATTTIEG